jgi:undecaprenyl-diphosphatase
VEGGRFLMGHKTSFSFPSSHAMNMFTAAMVLACFYRKQWPWFFGFAALIGYSRIYVGVHYPADVAAGALFGIATGALVFALFSLIKNSVEGRTASKGPKPNAPETGTAP